MDLDMYKHPTTKASLKKLQTFGNIMIPAGEGELASGLFGEGRMAEPEDIVQFMQEYLSGNITVKRKKDIDYSRTYIRSHRPCSFRWQSFLWSYGI